MSELNNKDLLELYKILKDFVENLSQKLEDIKNDWEDKWRNWKN